MRRIVLRGINGANPLGFMASVGLLRVLHNAGRDARLGFTDDGAFSAWFEGTGDVDLAGLIAADASAQAGAQPWRLAYLKHEKSGTKTVFDLKPPPAEYAAFAAEAVSHWITSEPVQADYAAAFATDVAVDGKGNVKPTAFHFTAGNQQFLDTVEKVREYVTPEWAAEALARSGAARSGPNLRFDPDAERSRALMGVNPTEGRTVVNAPLEWLAFRALPVFPCVPRGSRIVTTAVTGHRQNDMRFHWPLWSCGADYATVRSLIALAVRWTSDRAFPASASERRVRGIVALCSSEIRRVGQGYGSFGPASISA